MKEKLEIDNLKELLQKKKLEVYNEKNNIEDREKIYALENLFNNDRCFFKIKFEIAIKILKYLGVNDGELLNVYNRLIDPDLLKSNIQFKKL